MLLRPGTQHSTKGTNEDLRLIVPMAQWLSAAGPKVPVLARLRAGFDAVELMAALDSLNEPGLPQLDSLIKLNPRCTDVVVLARRRDAAQAHRDHPRSCKRTAFWEQDVEVPGVQRRVRCVLRLLERAIDAGGQRLGAPEYELDGWKTTLPDSVDAAAVIRL